MVSAHPGRYPLGKRGLTALIDDFIDIGFCAIEVSYGNVNPRVRNRLWEPAAEKEVFVSAGADFQDAAAHRTDIGRFPAIDEFGRKMPSANIPDGIPRLIRLGKRLFALDR